MNKRIIKSELHLADVMPNKRRRFGSALEYYPVMGVMGNNRVPMLFTISQIRLAIKRGMRNKEDIGELALERDSVEQV